MDRASPADLITCATPGCAARIAWSESIYVDGAGQLCRACDRRYEMVAIPRMGTPDGDGLWQRVSQSAYLESDAPHGAPFTGRQFSNDEVFRAGTRRTNCATGTPAYRASTIM